jgi:hypothetical protein
MIRPNPLASALLRIGFEQSDPATRTFQLRDKPGTKHHLVVDGDVNDPSANCYHLLTYNL